VRIPDRPANQWAALPPSLVQQGARRTANKAGYAPGPALFLVKCTANIGPDFGQEGARIFWMARDKIAQAEAGA